MVFHVAETKEGNATINKTPPWKPKKASWNPPENRPSIHTPKKKIHLPTIHLLEALPGGFCFREGIYSTWKLLASNRPLKNRWLVQMIHFLLEMVLFEPLSFIFGGLVQTLLWVKSQKNSPTWTQPRCQNIRREISGSPEGKKLASPKSPKTQFLLGEKKCFCLPSQNMG